MTSIWPRGTEYQTAVQNPNTAFADEALRSAKVELLPLGLPRPYSGGVTSTYCLQGTDKWAVRCFTRDIPDLEERYRAIDRFLETNPSPRLVAATYLPKGIRVGGAWYPIVKMPWVEGEPLNLFITKNLSNRLQLVPLPAEFRALVDELEQLNFIHGDLQHGNIIVKNGKLQLIDYDGAYVPDLSASGTSEVSGHVNYQHPGRVDASPESTIDRFPAIVIYMGLLAISVAPQLWTKYDNGENLLFREEDFLDPDMSPLLAELSALPELLPFVERFKRLCKAAPGWAPTLEQFIAGQFTAESAGAPSYALRAQYPVRSASDTAVLLRYVGQRMTVIGQITDWRQETARSHQPYVLLNFGPARQPTCSLLLWSYSYEAIQQFKLNPLRYVNRWASMTGVVVGYKNRPLLLVEQPSQIEVLSEEEAMQRLARVAEPNLPGLATTTPPERRVPETIPDSAARPTTKQQQVTGRFYASAGKKKKTSPAAVLGISILVLALVVAVSAIALGAGPSLWKAFSGNSQLVAGISTSIPTSTVELPSPTSVPTTAPTPTTAAIVLPSPSPVPTEEPSPTATAVPTQTRLPSPTPTIATRTAMRTLYVCSSAANVRSGPGYDFPPITQIFFGAAVPVYSLANGWYEASVTGQGQKQYINESLLCDQPVALTVALPTATLSPTPSPTWDICASYTPPAVLAGHSTADNPEPIRGIKRPNSFKVYFDWSESEYWDQNEKAFSQYFGCPVLAEAAGFIRAHPKHQ